MTRQEAINVILTLWKFVDRSHDSDIGIDSELIRQAFNLAIKALEEDWILCSERLPEPQTEVVVSFDNGEIKILWQNWADPSSLSNYPGEPLAYIGGDGIPHTYEEWESMKTYAVAWMPLPEPYAERRTDDLQ